MKVFLLTTLLLFSINGFAFNWKKLNEDINGNSFYIDVDNIKKRNGLVYYWTLFDLIEPLSNGSNSSIIKFKVDCLEGKRIWLSSTFYSQQMGKGKIHMEGTSEKFDYPKPNNHHHDVMKFACNNAR